MIKRVLVLILSFALSISFAQTTKHFFSVRGEESDSLNSYYYVVSTQLTLTVAKSESFYSASGSIRHREDKADKEGNSFRTYFFPNGKMKGEGHFKYSMPVGKFTSYYENGMKQGEFVFLESKPSIPDIKITNYWDSLGNQIVVSGSGSCNCWLDPYNDIVTMESGVVKDGFKVGQWKGEQKTEGVSFEEIYKDGNLIRGVQTNNGATYKYTNIIEMAGPKNGTPGMLKYITTNVRYPRMARKQDIQGTVFIAFVAEEDGTLSEFNVVKGIYKECDDEALRVVSSLPKFNNGTYE